MAETRKKRVLVTGANGYIGANFCLYAGERFEIVRASLREKNWETQSWQGCDCVLHAAGLAHVKETRQSSKLFYQINRDLSFDAARKAKQDKVGQFVFLSSASVYGEKNTLRKTPIGVSTPLTPDTDYGRSKAEAEKLISTLGSEDFSVSILRPPMVYGGKCKGNFPRLVKLAKKAFVFPKLNNCRSMIFIENLCELICLIIESNSGGIFLPQNSEYLSTGAIVKTVRDSFGDKTHLSGLLSAFVAAMFPFSCNIRKVFGNFMYDKKQSFYFDGKYQKVTAKEGVRRSL